MIGVLLLHPGGHTGPRFARKLDMSPWPFARISTVLGRKLLIRAPSCEGFYREGTREISAWTWPGDGRPPALGGDDRDVEIVRRAVAELYAAGCERVVAICQSSGAVFAWWLATHPAISGVSVDAWAPCSFGLPEPWVGLPDDGRPVYHEMGTRDDHGDTTTAVEHLVLRGGPGLQVDLDPSARRALAREYGNSVVVRIVGGGHEIRLREEHSTHYAALRWLVQRRGW